MRIFLDSVGCRLNQSEIESFARQFRAAGYVIVDHAGEADLVVVNTCTVTAAAASDSRQKIRQAIRAGGGGVIATGCWATLEPEAAAGLPGVTRVVTNREKEGLVASILGLPPEKFDYEPLARDPLPGIHWRTRAFIKAQDGCDNFCTFCITRLARGKGRSQPLAAVLVDIRAAVQGGAREIVLSGVHLGSWGSDLGEGIQLRHLLEAILADTDVERVRLSSIEPWGLDELFFRLWENPRMCRHFHLPLQSGSARILKRMARKTTPQAYRRLIEMARGLVPGAAITTDIIVGFPGEGEDDFRESLEYVESIGFAGGHVFTYSLREGTAASRLKDFIDGRAARARNAAMRAVLDQSALRYRKGFLGAEAEVLWESCDRYGPQGWRLHGLTGNYIRVEAQSKVRLWNQISRVRLIEAAGRGMAGEILG
jgi:threonylcarbamoyladenosine tRNA methylthiotransferase MtaB